MSVLCSVVIDLMNVSMWQLNDVENVQLTCYNSVVSCDCAGVGWPVLQPFQLMLLTVFGRLLLPLITDVVSRVQKCSRIRLRPGLRPGPCCGSFQHFPMPPTKGGLFLRGGKREGVPPNKNLPLHHCRLFVPFVSCTFRV